MLAHDLDAHPCSSSEFQIIFKKRQVESVKLSSDSSVKGLEAEAAQARRAVAQMEAAAKKDRANWVSELEMQKFEVCSSFFTCFRPSIVVR